MTANQIAFYQAQEQARHNQAMEALEQSKQGESVRHNMASEDVALKGHQETVRSNKAREEETNRFNLASVGAKNTATYLQDRINQANVKIAQQRADNESSRVLTQNAETWANIDKIEAQTNAVEASRLRDLAAATKDLVTADLAPAGVLSQVMGAFNRMPIKGGTQK